jgi:hypothetical protein
MNAKELAKQAAISTGPYARAFSAEILEKLELAYVANWLASQDESVQAAALRTAIDAIDAIRSYHAEAA